MNIKSVSPYDDSNVGWTVWGGAKDPEGIDKLAQRVPWFYRGIKDRANNVSHMPWAVFLGEDELANSAEWSYEKPVTLDFITNPRKLLSQIEQSLVMAGKAYLAMECNKSGYVKALKYLNPDVRKHPRGSSGYSCGNNRFSSLCFLRRHLICSGLRW